MHELTEKMMFYKNNRKEDNYKSSEQCLKEIDKIIREWLGEKRIEVLKSYGCGSNLVGKPNIEEILGIQEQTLAEKFEEYLDERVREEHLMPKVEDLVKIAEEHKCWNTR